MSKADELLQRLIYQAEMFAITYNNKEELSEVDSLLSDITYYLDRKDKLVIGSEWVCDVECYVTNGNQTYRIRKNKVLTITFFKEDGYNVYFDFYDDVLDTEYFEKYK